MRTPSQVFSDALQAKNHADAARVILQHGAEKSRALWWLAVLPHAATTGLLEQLARDQTISAKHAGDALLMALAQQKNWDQAEPIAKIALGHVSNQWWLDHSPIHHAAYHGNADAFDLLSEHHERVTGKEFDWNTANKEQHTPLFLSLSEAHLDATVEVLKRGGNPMSKITLPDGKTSTVLNEVFRRKQGVLGYMKQIWGAASDKAAMQSATGAAKTKAERKKKM